LKDSYNGVNNNWMMHGYKTFRRLGLAAEENLQNGYNGVNDDGVMHG
jgi:hypothetical protein